MTALLNPFILYSESTPSAIVPANLTLWLDAADTSSYPGSGNVWYDISGNGHDVEWATIAATTTAQFNSGGTGGGTFTLARNDSYFKSINWGDPVLPMNGYTKNFIFMLTNNSECMIGGDGGNYRHQLTFGGSDDSFSSGHDGDFFSIKYSLPSGSFENTWHVFGVTFDNATSSMDLYLDGTRVVTGTTTRQFDNDSPVMIGAHKDEPGSSGEAAVVLCHDRALTPTEMSDIYNHYATRFGL